MVAVNSLTNATKSLLASGERVLLQTATVDIQHPRGVATTTARVLLDSASQRTFSFKSYRWLVRVYVC